MLAVLWDAAAPLTAAQIATRLGAEAGTDTGRALGQLCAAGLVTATRAGRARCYQAVLGRDDYLAGLVAAALALAGDPAAVLRTALRAPSTA